MYFTEVRAVFSGFRIKKKQMGKLRQKGSGGQIMLEKVDLTMKMEKSEYKAKMTALKLQMGKLQRQCKEMGLPIMIVFEGFDAAGKGMQIGKLIQSLDPRGFEVFTVKEETKEEAMHPFLWRFWTKTPQRGRMAVYDGSWYIKVLSDRFEKKMRESEIENCYRSICSFEKQITEDGTLLIKLFLDIDQKEQKKRFDKLMESKDTAWRVTKADLKKNEKYDQYQEMIEEMLQRTDTEYAPWTIVEATDRRYATVKIYTVITQMLTAGIDNRRREIARETAAEVIREVEKEASENRSLIDGATKGFQESVLAKVDLSLCCDRKTYRKKLKEYQKKIEKLHGELYQKRIPVVIGFEGWDAAGKGGAIKRLTEKMDARGYVVNPTAAPNDLEKAHHYLWRFWKNMPKDGHIAIFDRTWYGRVMVERIEGFCTQEEWKRAYKEINDMEKDLADAGAVVLKFWMQIDKKEQEKRFRQRQENPEKQWKITEEDWRNREKWEQYEEAVNEMLIRTSTEYAPWIVVEGNDKYYARLKVLETVIDALEKRISKK
ncbi:polyphosphate:AMP phosphotransferase [Mediterraneibacter gnavus ATCC 29149]|uniref:Polyphosphate:AMP phosphotransferase n=2 Tax=Mediterraneibacter gnavus TaxID=33038 RepID=A7AZ90_MEDG7|nr:polyphosphate:AMP phosphotransferase [Mediterraneibacter gnavus ATCC 29149]